MNFICFCFWVFGVCIGLRASLAEQGELDSGGYPKLDLKLPIIFVSDKGSRTLSFYQRNRTAGGLIDRVYHTAGLRRAEMVRGVIADLQKIIRSRLRPANEH
jgi:hypothetical protein